MRQITDSDFLVGKPHKYAARFGLFFIAGLACCHRGAAEVSLPSEPLAAPPIESIWIRLPAAVTDVPTAIRQTMFRAGVQPTSDNRKERWISAALGGEWQDAARYRQWHIVAAYGADPVEPGVIVVLRTIEYSTSYTMPVGRPNTGRDPKGAGFTRTRPVTDMSTGEARAAWLQMERLALAFTDAGGELLTELVARR